MKKGRVCKRCIPQALNHGQIGVQVGGANFPYALPLSQSDDEDCEVSTSSIVYLLPSNFCTLYLSADGRTCDTCSFSLEQVTSASPNCKLLCVLLHRHACCLFIPFLNKLVSNLRSNSSLHLPIAILIQPLVAVQWSSVRRPKRHSTYSGAYSTSIITFEAARIFHSTRAPITIESVDITSSIIIILLPSIPSWLGSTSRHRRYTLQESIDEEST